MKGYACPNCGARQHEKVRQPGMMRTLCTACGKPLVVKISDTEITVTAKFAKPHPKREYG